MAEVENQIRIILYYISIILLFIIFALTLSNHYKLNLTQSVVIDGEKTKKEYFELDQIKLQLVK